jgi:hypothetical protein
MACRTAAACDVYAPSGLANDVRVLAEDFAVPVNFEVVFHEVTAEASVYKNQD